jgi:hypothetical protein
LEPSGDRAYEHVANLEPTEYGDESLGMKDRRARCRVR